MPPNFSSYPSNSSRVNSLLPDVGHVTPNTVNTPDATKYCPMEIAFSLIHSGAAPATGRSEMSSPNPPSFTIAVAAIRILELSTQDPRCSTGGIPTVSHTSASPAPAYSAAASGNINPAFAHAIAEHPV